ncbi:MAG: hypothetical protein JXQ29_06770 [Planctomycetes bacterium]|nr:hypothetical protein [Planctomycetota bacterium]
MEIHAKTDADSRASLRQVVHRINNFAAVIMTESELALLLGRDAERTAALRKVVSAVEEMRVYLRDVQRSLREADA